MANLLKTRKLVLAAFFCALTAVMAQMIIPLPPVPFSLAMVAIYLCGLLLDKKTAFWTQTAYLLLGAAGAPVFSGFSGGLGKLAGPTGGYLIVYPLMAFLIALIAEKWGHSFLKNTVTMALALLVCYMGGTVWLAISGGISFMAALAAGVLPFVAPDALKILLTAAFSSAVQKTLSRAGLFRTRARRE